MTDLIDQPFDKSDDAGGIALFGSSVWPHLAATDRALAFAERRLLSLQHLYDEPSTPAWHVEMEVTEFMTWARQSRVSMTRAVNACSDGPTSGWWAALDEDEELQRFTDRRNQALKKGEAASRRRSVDLGIIEGEPREMSYFAFIGQPYSDDPVYPRCLKHYARLQTLRLELRERLAEAFAHRD